MPASSPHSALIIGASRSLGRAFQSCEDDAVDGRNCANSGRSLAAWPTGHIDPKRAFRAASLTTASAEEVQGVALRVFKAEWPRQLRADVAFRASALIAV